MQIIKNKIVQLTLAIVLISFFAIGTTFAADIGGAGGGAGSSPNPSPPAAASHPCHPELDNPPGTKLTAPQLASCQACSQKNPTDAELNNCVGKNLIVRDLQTIAKFLSAGVGIVIVGSIIVGGIQYALAGNNSSAVSSAKKRLINSLIALIAFFFIFAFLNFIIPGGIVFS